MQPHFLWTGRSGDTSSIFLQINELTVANLKSRNICWPEIYKYSSTRCGSFVPPPASRQTNPRSHVIVPTSHVRTVLNGKDLNVFTLLSGWGLIPPLPPCSDFHKSKLKPTVDKLIHLPTSFFHHCSDLEAACRSFTDLHHQRWPQRNWFLFFFTTEINSLFFLL